MKRSIDEVCNGGSRIERQAVISRSEDSEQPWMVEALGPKGEPTEGYAMEYLRMVKQRFPENMGKYCDFVELLKDLKSQSLDMLWSSRIDAAGSLAIVKELFEGHPDLILGFNILLPEGFQIPFHRGIEVVLGCGVCDLIVGFLQAKFQGDDDHTYQSFLDIILRKENNSISTAEVAALLLDHPALVLEFPCVQPGSNRYAYSGRNFKSRDRSYSIPTMHAVPADKKDHNTTLHAQSGLSMERLRTYKDIVVVKEGKEKKWHGRKERVKREEIDSRDREQGCRDFENDTFDDKNGIKMSCCFFDLVISEFVWIEGQLRRLVNMEDRDRDQVQEKDDGMIERDLETLERGELDRISFGNKDGGSHKTLLSFSKDKFIGKSINELDLSNCEKCTPSYRLLPENYPRPVASERDAIGIEVLNDDWVSVTSGSEDYSFRLMRRNQYEEILFRCEDDRFELDMLLESAKEATKKVEGLLDNINEGTTKTDWSTCIKDLFTVQNIRCIERLYDDYGLDMMDELRKKNQLALPVILNRLKQKQEEWASFRSNSNKFWAEVYANNHHKSLDHRSFTFKQQDPKNLSTKALLAEIKEISEKKQEEHDLHLAIASGNRRSIIADMEFEYPDREIHEDLYQLIKYTCGELCTTGQLDEVMKIWTTFLEPMLGLPSRPQGAEDTEDIVKAKNNNVENGNSSFAEGEVDDATRRLFELQDGNCFRYNEESFRQHKVEMEEGEFFPNGDFEEGEFLPNGDLEEGEFLPNKDFTAYKMEDGASEDSENRVLSGKGNKGESKYEAEGMSDVYEAEGDGTLLPFSERCLLTTEPLAKHVPSALHENETDSRVFYGNDSFYVLFRLHQKLYERLQSAKNNSSSAGRKWMPSSSSSPADLYDRFMSALYKLLDGSSDHTKLRMIAELSLGLQVVAREEMDNKLLQLYAYEKLRYSGRFIDVVYQDNARLLLHDDNIYRIECVPYLCNDFLSAVPERKEKSRVFLKRNTKKCMDGDEPSSTGEAAGLTMVNGLECKIAFNSSKL
ncbi:hypothetical protein F3Y22_tig00110840pilonHSYRG00123 [Hibiscus syriacus]|uniref:Histone deacetylase interacting domain-containing protein n=1 Tax=Hibiscus syriacus TaxID=106335 RepID=A0A6A2ZLJ1_HIBSY|nr:hypothetical protein F3Y22_tig00110840pilonHSYRG00123 [Hibiscus syriacus]